MRPSRPNPYSIRTPYPSVWPQYPYNNVPRTPEQSLPRYTVQNDWNQAVAVRDGTKLLLDVYRPYAPGERFPALCSFSPYTRQLQRESAPIGQNEAGISEFWVPRGYAHVIIDVRGSNGSEGDWEMWGPNEQRDLADIIEWVAQQPWCNGSVGMMGCSYFAMTQNLAAEQQPPSLKAIFPYDALTDIYRDAYFNGGIPHDGFQRIWFSDVNFLNFWGGRNPNTEAMSRQFETILGMQHPLDGEYYWERSAWPNLDKIQVPAYFGCHWSFYNLHLRGSFDAWQKTPNIPNKRMLIGPTPVPVRQFACYHLEALRWYDHWLKGMDSGVLEGAPIKLWIEGEEVWREEQEWPLRRTTWVEIYLGGSQGSGALTDTPPADGEQELRYDPSSERWLWGEPRLVYRGEPFTGPTEITGPIQLLLTMASSAEDTDWIGAILEEAPDGSVRELTRGWLRSSHREVDPSKALPNQPWHPHQRLLPLTPSEPTELAIEIIPICHVFQPGHRFRFELSNSDNLVKNSFWYRRTLPIAATNRVLQGRGKSRLIVPVIPR
ncbi:MAG: CocE/NonD family hydrolase [Chloroflexi bacterium]|nr:CocE/NonD family hydrolase [Chloroflexota bacterium]